MSLPPDIEGRRFTWVRPPSYEWTTREFRVPVVSFLGLLEQQNGWVRPRSVVVVERIADTGVNVRVPLGPTAAVDQRAEQLPQRSGLPILNFRVTRDRDGRIFETSVPFEDGASTSSARMSVLLDLAVRSLRASEKAAR